MITNEEPVESLIDWNSPVVERELTSKPLIPLPAFTSPVEIAEDNPFDAVERQVNENELFDVLNLNLSFGSTYSNEQDSSDNQDHDRLIDLCEAVDNVDIKAGECESPAKYVGCDVPATSVNTSESKSNSNSEPLDTSPVSSLSNASDIKEMVMNRISLCINQALHETQSSGVSKRTTSERSSLASSRTTSPQSKLSCSLNDGFISLGGEHEGVDFARSFADVEDDLQSVVPYWDEISSSDEEPEKRVTSQILIVQKSNISSAKKRSMYAKAEKSSDVREPLLFQDPNVRVKKTNPISKQGPLKAVIPISNMKKGERKTAKPVNELKPSISKRSKTPTTLPCPKEKRWSSPVATSTPQGRISMSAANKTPVRKSQLPSQLSSTNRPPSPDSTSSSRLVPRVSVSLRGTPKGCVRKLASNVVSSSTSLLSSKEIIKGIRNKENVPFRY